jgi:hypothetical protein
MPAAPLLDLRVTHPFYADLRCSDLMIEPSAVTEALMRRLRLTCKAFSDHVSLYAELTSGGGAFAAAAAPVSLDFVLRARGAEFTLITDLSGVAAQSAPVFTNSGVAAADPLNLRLTTRTARATDTLTVSAPSSGETFVLAAAPLAGTTAADLAVTGAGAVGSITADRRRVTVNTSGLAAGATFKVSGPRSIAARLRRALHRRRGAMGVLRPDGFAGRHVDAAHRRCHARQRAAPGLVRRLRPRRTQQDSRQF